MNSSDNEYHSALHSDDDDDEDDEDNQIGLIEADQRHNGRGSLSSTHKALQFNSSDKRRSMALEYDSEGDSRKEREVGLGLLAPIEQASDSENVEVDDDEL